LNKTD